LKKSSNITEAKQEKANIKYEKNINQTEQNISLVKVPIICITVEIVLKIIIMKNTILYIV
jgi:hypothetical protein